MAPEDAAPKGDEKPAGIKRKVKKETAEHPEAVDVEYQESSPSPSEAQEEDVIEGFFS